MQVPAIRRRVEELIEQPVERVRAGLEGELLMLRHRAAESELTEEERANVELRLKLILAHAKLRGWIVDRRQVSKASIDVSKLLHRASGAADRAQLLEAFAGMLNQLQPGARKRLEAIAAAKPDPEVVDVESEK